MASEAITAIGEGGNLAASMACSRAVGIAMSLAINSFDRNESTRVTGAPHHLVTRVTGSR